MDIELPLCWANLASVYSHNISKNTTNGQGPESLWELEADFVYCKITPRYRLADDKIVYFRSVCLSRVEDSFLNPGAKNDKKIIEWIHKPYFSIHG